MRRVFDMGNQNNANFTNWNGGCGCAEETVVTTVNARETCGCEPCGCEARTACETCEPCGGRGKHKGCGCETAVSASCGCGSACTSNGGCGRQGECGNETHIIFETCDGYKVVNVTGSCQQDAAPGRVLDVNARLLNVCPGRRSALGLTLTELDGSGTERPCGFQAITVPAHNGRCNQDIAVETVRFILPEETCQQQRRHFIVRTQHHYLDAASIWNNQWGR